MESWNNTNNYHLMPGLTVGVFHELQALDPGLELHFGADVKAYFSACPE